MSVVKQMLEHDCHLSGEDGCDCCNGEHLTPEQLQERADYKYDEFIDDQIQMAQQDEDKRNHQDSEILELRSK